MEQVKYHRRPQSEEWERGFGPASGGGTSAARAESIEVPSLYHHYITRYVFYMYLASMTMLPEGDEA